MIRQLRLTLFVVLFGWIMGLVPKEATKTLIWITKMPKET